MLNIKRLIMALMAFMAIFATAQTNFSVLGDSYSTFDGHMSSEWNAIWYSQQTDSVLNNDVVDVNQTWWKILDATDQLQLDCNNSWSGSTICLTGYSAEDFSDRSFITRIHNIGRPEILFIFGGTNDSWANSPIGVYKYADWEESDLYDFRPAMAYLLANLKALYPNMRIINLINTPLKDEIIESAIEICNHYGVEWLKLIDVDKQTGHPSPLGMQQIAEQIMQYLNNNPS